MASSRVRLSSFLFLFQHCWNQRLNYILSLLLLLQRTPVIRHLMELPRQLAPKFADILRLTAPLSFTAGATHSLTGATGVVPVKPSVNPAAAKVGEPFTWVFRTTGEKAKSYSFDGLPLGIVHSGVVQNAVSSIGGTPTEPGQYKVRIIGWENSGQRGSKTPAYTLTLNITGGLPPVIDAHPTGGIFNEGDPVELSVAAAGSGLAYQWTKDGVALSGTASQNEVLRFDSVTPTDAGRYAVEVSNNNGTVTSDTVLIEIRPAGSLAHWEAVHGVSDPSADPDGDGLTNLTEYAIGSDPNVASAREGIPKVRLERLDGALELVAEFAINPEATDSLVEVETTSDLSHPAWTALRHGENGASISAQNDTLTVRVPATEARQFLRFTVKLR